jgi:6-phosphogluconolactonase
MNPIPLTTRPEIDGLLAEMFFEFVSLAEQSIRRRGVFRVALSGGTTPKRFYQLLADRKHDLSGIEWFWGDERNVEPDDPESNYRMVRESLLDPAGIDPAQVFPVPVRVADPAAAAAQYDRTLRERFSGWDALSPSGFPKWDLVLLGLGDDVHTASLFPESPALDRRDAWFVENRVEKFNAYRYTLTPPAINSGREIWFLVTGQGKREAIRKLIQGPENPKLYPAQLIRPTHIFLTDDATP